ncbi:MAG: D-sedoheptulose-7-phosphate isomerase [Candidatus Sumerlaeaceae bacterium]
MSADFQPPSQTESQVRAALDALANVVDAAHEGPFAQQVASAAEMIVQALANGNKVLTCGNGGSAADASHLAEELLGRYKQSRMALAAICLCADGAALTCIGNDFGFMNVFSRQLEALGSEGDVLVVFTTSGRSENINRVLCAAREKQLRTITVCGADGGESAKLAELVVAVPSSDSARIQEMHTFVLHSICEECERRFAHDRDP